MSVWTAWSDEKWLSSPPLPPTFSGDEASWKKRVSFMQRKIRGELAPLSPKQARRSAPTEEDYARFGAVVKRVALKARGQWRPPPPQPKPRPSASDFGKGWTWPVRTDDLIAEYRQHQREEQREELRRAKKMVEKFEAERLTKQRAAEHVERVARVRLGPPPSFEQPLERRTSSVKVGDEPLVYGPGSDFSWFADVHAIRACNAGAIPSRRAGMTQPEVSARIVKNEQQMADLARRDEEARALLKGYFTQRNREWHGTVSDRSREDFANFTSPALRTATTNSASMGSFTPPVFALQQWELYRTAASPVASQARQRPLPASGMKVSIPKFTTKITVTKQTEADTVTASTPTTAYSTADVITLTARVTLSIQVLDRLGVEIDLLILEQAGREAGTILDAEAILAILDAAPQSVTDSSTISITNLWTDIGKGMGLLRTEEGTRLPPDCLMLSPNLLSWFQSQVDSEGRPIWLPSPSGSARVGAVTSPLEGYSGYDVLGARVFTDANLTVTDTKVTNILGNFSRGLVVYSAPPIVDIWPDGPGAKALTVTATFRQYAALAIIYPKAFCTISGAAYPSTPEF